MVRFLTELRIDLVMFLFKSRRVLINKRLLLGDDEAQMKHVPVEERARDSKDSLDSRTSILQATFVISEDFFL